MLFKCFSTHKYSFETQKSPLSDLHYIGLASYLIVCFIEHFTVRLTTLIRFT